MTKATVAGSAELSAARRRAIVIIIGSLP